MNAPSTKIAGGSLATAMAGAFAEIEAATKDATNPHFKAKYAGLGAVIDAIKPSLIKHSLFFTQRPHPSEGGVSVETVLHHSSGEEMSLGTLFVPANKNDAQGFGSALTYCRRYGLLTAFGVPTEDDDGAAASRSTGEPPPKARVALDGPHKSPTALQAAIKAFLGVLDGMTDSAEFSAWMATPEVVELEKQALRDAPAWWETGENMPNEFEPVASRIHRKKRALEEAENIHNIRTPVDAG